MQEKKLDNKITRLYALMRGIKISGSGLQAKLAAAGYQLSAPALWLHIKTEPPVEEFQKIVREWLTEVRDRINEFLNDQ